MNSVIKLLRHYGRRKPDREIQSEPGTIGDLTLALCAGGCEAKLSGDDGSRQEPLIPILYEARLITMHGNKMLLRGVERSPDGAEHVQEWSVLIHYGAKANRA